MKRFFGRREGEQIIIDGGELIHLRQVLRMQKGDKVIVSLNDKFDYYCTLDEVGKSKAVCTIDEVKECPTYPKKEIVLFIAMPKREYFETILTKSTELGVSKIVPFKSKFTVNHDFKRERAEQILLTACKQCERSILPELCEVEAFDKMLKQLAGYDMVIFANEHESKTFDFKGLKTVSKIAVIVGAEAGFSEEEAEAIKASGAKSISLGSRILRCDTAATALMAIVGILSGN